MTRISALPPPLFDDREDYTDAVCLLLPKGHATLVDLDFFGWAVGIEWQVLGRTIFRTIRITSRKTQMQSLHRDAIRFGLGDLARWNLDMRLRRQEVDHISRNPWDNRRCNLRLATKSQNRQNRPGSPNSSSRFKGVVRVAGKEQWKASATIKGKTYRLGVFDDEIDAALAYNRFVAERCGEFAYLNPIEISGDYEPPKRKRRHK